MQIGMSYIHEGELFVAVTMCDTKGQMLCEGFSSGMARHYAAMLIQCADKLDEHKGEDRDV